jgi:hypothetical protein
VFAAADHATFCLLVIAHFLELLLLLQYEPGG